MSTELFTEGKFSYQVLTPAHKDAAHAVLARAFCRDGDREAEMKPEMKTEYIDWLEFIDYWMEQRPTSGLSMIALDKVNYRVAGVFMVQDLLLIPPPAMDLMSGPRTKVRGGTSTVSPWMGFLWHMDAEAIKKIPELGEPGKAVDLWSLGVHPDYKNGNNNKIATYLTKGVMSLLKNSGFKYGTIKATNTFTSEAAKWNNFTAVYSMEPKDFLWKGEPIYTNMEPPQGTYTFWVKDLQQD